MPHDKNGMAVGVGDTIRLLSLSGQWLDDLPFDEKQDVLSMIGEVFEIEEVDEYDQPWVSKAWPNEAEGKFNSHSVALEPHEMELVRAKAL